MYNMSGNIKGKDINLRMMAVMELAMVLNQKLITVLEVIFHNKFKFSVKLLKNALKFLFGLLLVKKAVKKNR